MAIEIVDWPSYKMGGFSIVMLVYQRVHSINMYDLDGPVELVN